MTTPEPAAPEALLPGDHERRLHPGSWLFVLLQNLRQFIVPLLVLLFAGGRRDDGYPWWLPMIGVGALVVVSVVALGGRGPLVASIKVLAQR